MAGGAKDFFFAGADKATDTQESEPTREAQPEPAEQSEEAPPPSFFNPTESAPAAEEETQPSAFFKAPTIPSSVNEEQPKGAFFANLAAPTKTSDATTRPSFFNPGGLTTNPFPGGSGNNEVGEDSEVEGDRDREVETND